MAHGNLKQRTKSRKVSRCGFNDDFRVRSSGVPGTDRSHSKPVQDILQHRNRQPLMHGKATSVLRIPSIKHEQVSDVFRNPSVKHEKGSNVLRSHSENYDKDSYILRHPSENTRIFQMSSVVNL